MKMDNTYRKKRYARYNSYSRNKKANYKDDFIQKVTKQIITCCIIFLIILGIKNLNTPITNKVSDKIKMVLGYTVDVNNTYKSVEAFAENMGLMGKKDVDGKAELQNSNLNKNETKEGQEGTTKNIQDSVDSTVKEDSNQSLKGELSLDTLKPNNITVCKEEVKITQDIIPPLQGVITSKFGIRKHPIYHKELFHYGMDIEGSKGNEIVAVMNGEVTETGEHNNYGKYIRIKHQNDILTFYAHCSKISVKTGQKVKKGESIGEVGDSGAALGTHLHFEMWKGDKVLNPMDHIKLPVAPSVADVNVEN